MASIRKDNTPISSKNTYKPTASQVIDVQRLLNALNAINNGLKDVENSLNVIEASVATAPPVPAPILDPTLLPDILDFSSNTYSNTVVVYDIVDLGPAVAASFTLEITMEANTIVSFPFTSSNTTIRSVVELTATVQESQPSPVTGWLSIQPGGPSIAYNSYLGDRAMAFEITTEETNYLVECANTVDANSIYTHAELIQDAPYWINFTYQSTGNFTSRGKMNVDYVVPAGNRETTITLSGNTIVYEVE